MTDPTTPLTDESEELLAEVHGTQMALTVFPARLRAIEAAAARRAIEGSGVVEALRNLLDNAETVYMGGNDVEAWTVQAMLNADIIAARRILAALPCPEKPRVERCGWRNDAGVRCPLSAEDHAAPATHPFTPEAR